MKLIVFSDTHGNYPAAVRAAELFSPADMIIHLGDTVEDALLMETALGRRVIHVAGNCDPGADPCELSINLNGIGFFACHGDRYGVKSGLARLKARAAGDGMAVVLYGHTHVAGTVASDGILFINPGTMREGYPQTFAVVTVEDKTVSAEIVTLPA